MATVPLESAQAPSASPRNSVNAMSAPESLGLSESILYLLLRDRSAHRIDDRVGLLDHRGRLGLGEPLAALCIDFVDERLHLRDRIIEGASRPRQRRVTELNHETIRRAARQREAREIRREAIDQLARWNIRDADDDVGRLGNH